MGTVFLILMNNMLYPSIVFFFEIFSYEDDAEKSESSYDIYSFQINAWLLMIPCYLSCFLKKIAFIANLAQIGIYVLCAYILFLFYVFFDNLAGFWENCEKINYFTMNVTEVSGAFSLAFFIHAAICPLVKNIAKKEESTKALAISYFLSSFFYFLIGIVGYFGILAIKKEDAKGQTIMDFYEKKSFLPFIIKILYFCKLATVYPIFCFLSKNQFFSLFSSKEKKIHWVFSFIYNSLYMAFGMICVLFNINLSFIIGFSGAVFGFVLVYLIPVYFHLKCFDSSEGVGSQCNEHRDKFEVPRGLRRCFYLVFIVPVGVYLMIIQLIALFDFKWL